jgi:hypothetical protein
MKTRHPGPVNVGTGMPWADPPEYFQNFFDIGLTRHHGTLVVFAVNCFDRELIHSTNYY